MKWYNRLILALIFDAMSLMIFCLGMSILQAIYGVGTTFGVGMAQISLYICWFLSIVFVLVPIK